ncbi:MAG: hypothetical protein F2737_09445 [Actinobacteria bacterium]|uniref:Unannotated protein n=1 Tax=freshwater metagenome TaxID=449393 RepID=A0A6J6Z2X1_9ZZZZ|nr:hypothetical protein [Actinomycetota bacterium]
MTDRVPDGLAGRILSSWGDWTGPVVESAVFGTTDPTAIAGLIGEWAVRHLGSPVASVLWYHASVGCASGLVLADGTRVVVKAHQPRFHADYLAAAVAVQSHLAAVRYPCPTPLGGPEEIGVGLATASLLIRDDGGAMVPDTVSAVAALVRLTTYVDGMAHCGYAEGHVQVEHLAPHPLGALRDGALYPEPYSPAFSFRDDESASWIDRYAGLALAACADDNGPLVVSHGDWSPRNVRGDRFGVSAVFDMDSLVLTTEARAAGHAAASWLLGPDPIGTVLDPSGIEHFLWLHQRIRDYWLAPQERRAAWGAALWNLAHLARCEHGVGTAGAALAALAAHGGEIAARCSD